MLKSFPFRLGKSSKADKQQAKGVSFSANGDKGSGKKDPSAAKPQKNGSAGSGGTTATAAATTSSGGAASSSCARRASGRVWREARDPKTGRTYYYDVETRETQWTKPSELLSASERAEIERREREKRSFFEEMEANMKRRFADGLTSVDMGLPTTAAAPAHAASTTRTNGIGWRPPRVSSGSFSSTSMVRTLSTMDDSFLEFAQGQSIGGRPSSERRRSLSPSASRRDSNAENFMPRIPEGASAPSRGAAPPNKANKPGLPLCSPGPLPSRVATRNSTGTLYLDATLDAPDKEATIRCVCHVVRAHIAASSAGSSSRHQGGVHVVGAFAVFHDEDADPEPPSARRLVSFYRDVFSRGQMELECIVTSLIYVERLLKASRGKFRLGPSNWRPVLLSCMIMASKVCDDLSMWNADFSHICRAFDLARINELEAALLRAYGFNATVAASEYAKYYFHLRSMAARLGLGGANDMSAARPLDVRAARAVAARSRRFQDEAGEAAAPSGAGADGADGAGLEPPLEYRRAQSIAVATKVADAINKYHQPKARQAMLEEIVDMAPTNTP